MGTWAEALERVGLQKLANDFHGLNAEEAAEVHVRMRMVRPEYRDRMRTMAQDLRPYNLWVRYRETYEPHPELSRALVKMRSDSMVPGEVFERLRHQNPLFLISGTPPITHADGHPGRILAIMVGGAVSKKYERPGDSARLSEDTFQGSSILTDTSNPHCNAYHVTVLSEVHNPDGTQITDFDFCHLTIPIRTAFTLDDLVAKTASTGFAWSTAAPAVEESKREYLTSAARAAVSHLLYACSRTVELDDKPRASRPPMNRKKGQPKPPPSARIHRMGWRIGAAITDTVKNAGDRPAGPGTGKKVAPHVRGAHLHLYRVGPGRKEIEMKWLDPIPVNASLDDGKTITRHPMR
jgi:hypothetical protein